MIATCVALAGGAAGTLGCWISGELSPQGSVAFGTFLMTGILWVTGAMPPHVAGTISIAMLAATLPTGLLPGAAPTIGTTPNVIAYGLIRDAGFRLGFLDWLIMGVPIAAVAVVTSALLLRSLARGFPSWPEAAPMVAVPRLGLAGWTWCALFAATVLLWSTQPWTGIPIEHASLLPILALPALGLMRGKDLKALDWRTLGLLFAGLVLGMSLGATGVAEWIVAWSVPAAAPPFALVAIFCAVSIVLSTFMSNTATANLLVPIALAIGDRETALPCALAAALGSSLAVGLPVSTPPMLLAHATGFVRPRELAMIGLVVGVIGTLAVTAAVCLT